MDFEKLETEVRRSRHFAAMLAVSVVAIYFIRMWLAQHNSISAETEEWGQFGDFIGGMLNPVIAYLAFYWLTRSIVLQKEELTDTRKTLQTSAQAQLKQERHAARTAHLNALNSLLNSFNNDLSRIRDNIQFLAGQLEGSMHTNVAHNVNGDQTTYAGLVASIKESYKSVEIIVGDREDVIGKIKASLDEADV